VRTAYLTGRREKRRPWTRDELLSHLRHDPVEHRVVKGLLAWADDRRLRLLGTEAESPGLKWGLEALGWDYTFIIAITRPEGAVTGTHRLGIEFGNLSKRPVLDDRNHLEALASAIGRISALPRERPLRYPSIPMEDLAGEAAFRAFTKAWDDVINDIRREEGEHG
jgi:hypothetical protein